MAAMALGKSISFSELARRTGTDSCRPCGSFVWGKCAGSEQGSQDELAGCALCVMVRTCYWGQDIEEDCEKDRAD